MENVKVLSPLKMQQIQGGSNQPVRLVSKSEWRGYALDWQLSEIMDAADFYYENMDWFE